MVLREIPSRSCDAQKVRRATRRVATVVVLLGLAACNPVETWRDLTGASSNDPDPATTPNSRNLATGEAADYPNLATVPPPPSRAMTAAEREKLTQSLIADRANARYTDERLRAGFSAAPAAPPPPPSAPGSEAAAPSAPVASALPLSPGPSPTAETPPASAAVPVTANSKPLPQRPAAPQPVVATADQSIAAEKPPGAEPEEKPSRSRSAGKKTDTPGQGLRKQGEPPEPGPMESSLEIPQARATPQPEQIQPAPPPPQLPPTPRVATAAPAVGGGLAVGGALAPILPRGANPPAGFEPPPAPPELPAIEATRSEAAGAGKAAPKPAAPAGARVAEIKFGGDATTLSENDRKTLESVVPLYQRSPGKVRVVGYATPGSGAVEQLGSYRAALDRAQAVANALTKAGIPSDKIQVEASPTGAASGESRAEVLLEH